MYQTFTRNWWKENKEWPDGLEPDPRARKYKRGTYGTEEAALRACKEWNDTHKPGRLSNKMEYTEIGRGIY